MNEQSPLAVWYVISTFILIILIPFWVTSTFIGSSKYDYVIKNDPGGSILIYRALANSLKGKKVAIDGPCYSACTMFAETLRYKIDLCVTERAVLGFHIPYVRIGDTTQISEELAKRFEAGFKERITGYPVKIQEILRKSKIPNPSRTGDPFSLLLIKGSKLLEAYPKCS